MAQQNEGNIGNE